MIKILKPDHEDRKLCFHELIDTWRENGYCLVEKTDDYCCWIEEGNVLLYDYPRLIDRPPKNFKIGFLPTASKDNQKKIDLFYKRFENSNLELSHFSLCSKIEGFKGWLLSKDIIYVGGGNTFYMLEIWKKNNLIEIFNKPSEENNILNGIDNLIELDNIENEILINEFNNKIEKDL